MPKVPKLSQSQIDKILAADEANIAKLVKGGRPLPKWLRQKLEDQRHGNAEPGSVWASNFEELRKALGISRPTLIRLRKKKGCPKAGANGKHHVPTWRQFASVNVTKKVIASDPDAQPQPVEDDSVSKRELESLRKLKHDADAAEYAAEEARFDLELKKGRYLLKSEVRDAIIKANEKVKAELQRHFIQTLPAEYEQCLGEQKECREINRRSLDEITKFLNRLEL